MADSSAAASKATVKKAKAAKKAKRPNVFARIGLFIKQMFVEMRKVVAPNRKELWNWSIAVSIFVVILMLLVTALDFGLGKLMLLIFG